MRLPIHFLREPSMKHHMRLLQQIPKIGTYTTQLAPKTGYERLIVAHTVRNNLLLDLDHPNGYSRTVKFIRILQQEYPDIGDCLLCESSQNKFHCIFNNFITWKRAIHIYKVLMGLGILNRNFIKTRTFREDLTLRVSSVDRGIRQSDAPKPIGIIKFQALPSEDHGIQEYLTVLSAYRLSVAYVEDLPEL